MELEQIKYKLDKNEYDYFLELSNILELPFYFIGSIGRNDYIKGKSDFDIEVFSDNVVSTKLKIDYLFKDFSHEDKFIVFRIDDVPFSAYKYYLINKENNFRVDFTLYKKECIEILLYHRKIERELPFYITVLLIIIKYLHYYFYVINNSYYSYLKKNIWYLYNPNKTKSMTIKNDEKYKTYYENENIKTYLIDL